MATLITLLAFFFFLLPHAAATTCGVSACAASGLSIRFPFRLTDRQPPACGYSSIFDLSCNNLKQTILTLPASGNFTVDSINYSGQLVWINDHDNCIFKRFLNKDFSLVDSPFQYRFDLQEYTFYNCTPQPVKLYMWTPISCLSSHNYEVIGVPSWSKSWSSPSPFCDVISTALVPSDTSEFGVSLTWNKPDCRFCEASGKACGFQNGSRSMIHCSSTLSYGMIYSQLITYLICYVNKLQLRIYE